ncbi:MAG: WD40/YVTN/BNR-like repeat-containing protein [Chloroflexota bacterium]
MVSPVLDQLEWRCIGPHRGGRVVAVAGDPRDLMTFYFGACAGGVWKTTDGGTYWECVSDGFFQTAAVGALAVAPSDPNVIYAGMGETTIRGDVSHGDGVYKSTDGGSSWRNIGLQETRHIAKIRIHPENPDLVYVAALGDAFGPNEERGIFRSRDGGETWDNILFRGDRAGGIDLSLDPTNPRLLYAALWEAQRTPWSLNSGGPGSGLFRSTDGGDSWTEITRNPGLPKGTIGKIGVAVSPAQTNRVWALIEAEDGALFRSDDGGESWQRLCDDPKLRRRAWYYTHLFADPQDAETCWVLNLACWKSVDGGKTFDAIATGHGDNHDLWIDSQNPRRLIEGNDGGAQVSFNGGLSWSTLYNQPTAQLYHVTTDTRVPYRVYGSQQDNSAISLPSMSLLGAIGETEWFVPGGGESGYIAVRPDNPDVIFGGAIGSGFGNGLLWRYDRRTENERNITVWPEVIGMGEGAEALKYRFQWTFPVALSPHDPNVLYVAGNQLFRSTDEGESWEVISPDLTRNDKSKQESSGGPLTKDNTGAEVYDTIFAFVESPHQQGLFWVGTDDGLVQLSRDGGQNWENITPPDLPVWSLISIIEVSPFDPGTAYLAATRYKLQDGTPYLYKTADYGKTWRRITDGIAPGDFTRVIRADPECRDLLYAGTETGIYVSFDDGEHWRRLGGNLPVTPIHDLMRKDGDLVVATHGRSFWILDDVAMLHQLAGSASTPDEPHLFVPAPTERYRLSEWTREFAAGVNYAYAGPVVYGYRVQQEPNGRNRTKNLDVGTNPPAGVAVRYYLPTEPDGEITLSFLDEAGTELRTFKSKQDKEPAARTGEALDIVETRALELGIEGMEGQPVDLSIGEEVVADEEQPVVPKVQGLNRFIWDMRLPNAHKVKGDESMDFFLMGPAVLPGTYQVRLTVGDKTYTERFEILPDPRGVRSREELQAQFDLLGRINEKLTAAHDAINQIREITGQLDIWIGRLKGQAALTTMVTGLKRHLVAVDEALIEAQPKTNLHYTERLRLSGRLAGLKYAVDFTDNAPTRQAIEVYGDLAGRIDRQVDRFQKLLNTDLPALNEKIRQSGTPMIAPTPIDDQ